MMAEIQIFEFCENSLRQYGTKNPRILPRALLRFAQSEKKLLEEPNDPTLVRNTRLHDEKMLDRYWLRGHGGALCCGGVRSAAPPLQRHLHLKVQSSPTPDRSATEHRPPPAATPAANPHKPSAAEEAVAQFTPTNDPKEIVRRSMEIDRSTLDLARNYTCQQREVIKHLDKQGT